MADERGELLFTYIPLPATPLAVALLILVSIVTFVLGPILGRPDFWPLGGLCFVPFTLLVLWVVSARPTPTRIYANGIEVSVPRWRRLARSRPWLPWDTVVNVYPASYEIGGAAMSPFASSAGTLIHRGIGLEIRDGRRLLVQFTPPMIRAFRGETEGYAYAMIAIRAALTALGRPLVTSVKEYTDAEILAMQADARTPLVSIVGVIFAFFLPPSLVAIVLSLAPPANAAVLVLAAGVAAIPPTVSILVTRQRSIRRNYLLGEIAKFQEWKAPSGEVSSPSPG